MSEPFILCEGLVKIYKVADLEMVALHSLNLSIERGELVGIIGSSGSGKSTIMNILGGLDRPTAGKVKVDGHDLLRMSDGQLNQYRREKVGFVWQQSTRNLVPYLNAIQNVMLPMTLAGATGQEKQNRAEELLDIVGLSERKQHHVQELSGGEQQRVAIAVGLANSPSLLLADEPTGEVDTTTAKAIYRTFQTLSRDIGITTLIVSHDRTIARQVDRVVGIRDGMLASETIRHNQSPRDDEAVAIHEDDDDHHYRELVVLDNAGRVHIPQEFLEQFHIQGRAQLEVTEEGILIRQAEQTQTEQVRVESDGAGGGMKRMEHAGVHAVKRVAETPKGIRRFFGGFGRKKR